MFGVQQLAAQVWRTAAVPHASRAALRVLPAGTHMETSRNPLSADASAPDLPELLNAQPEPQPAFTDKLGGGSGGSGRSSGGCGGGTGSGGVDGTAASPVAADEPHWLRLVSGEAAVWLARVFELPADEADALAEALQRCAVDGHELQALRDTSSGVRRMVLTLWLGDMDGDEDALQHRCDIFYAALLQDEDEPAPGNPEAEAEGERLVVALTAQRAAAFKGLKYNPGLIHDGPLLTSNRVGTLQHGQLVRVLEEQRVDVNNTWTHTRVRIGPDRWASREMKNRHSMSDESIVIMIPEGTGESAEETASWVCKLIGYSVLFVFTFWNVTTFMVPSLVEYCKNKAEGVEVVEQSRSWTEEMIGGAPIWARNSVLAFYLKKGFQRASGFKGSGRGLAKTLLVGGKATKRKTAGAGWLALVGNEGGVAQARAPRSSWDDARNALGYEPRQALSVAVAKLLFWHWSQPLGYLWVYANYMCRLTDLQVMVGTLVAVREMVYLLMTIVATISCPAYLLLDLQTVWHEAKPGLERGKRIVTYAFTPHNYVAMCLSNRFPGKKYAFMALVGFQAMCDCASCMALALLLAPLFETPVAARGFNYTATLQFVGDDLSPVGQYHMLNFIPSADSACATNEWGTPGIDIDIHYDGAYSTSTNGLPPPVYQHGATLHLHGSNGLCDRLISGKLSSYDVENIDDIGYLNAISRHYTCERLFCPNCYNAHMCDRSCGFPCAADFDYRTYWHTIEHIGTQSEGQWAVNGEGVSLVGEGWSEMFMQPPSFPFALAIGYSLTALGFVAGFVPTAAFWFSRFASIKGWNSRTLLSALALMFVGVLVCAGAFFLRAAGYAHGSNSDSNLIASLGTLVIAAGCLCGYCSCLRTRTKKGCRGTLGTLAAAVLDVALLTRAERASPLIWPLIVGGYIFVFAALCCCPFHCPFTEKGKWADRISEDYDNREPAFVSPPVAPAGHDPTDGSAGPDMGGRSDGENSSTPLAAAIPAAPLATGSAASSESEDV